MNRRTTIKTISLVAGSALLSPASLLSEKKPTATFKDDSKVFSTIEEIAKGVFFAKGSTSCFKNGDPPGVECNNGWIVFDDFVLVIDSNFPGTASDLRLTNQQYSKINNLLKYENSNTCFFRSQGWI